MYDLDESALTRDNQSNVPRRRQAASVLGLFAFFCPCASALNPSLEVSQYAHTAWTVRDGFFNGGINAIGQDREGYYLLLASEAGLLRFDGVRPTPWLAGEQIARGDIRTVLAASDGRVWAGMASGLSSWKDGHRTDYPELAGQRVLSILQDTQGTVWVAGYAIPTGRLCAFRDNKADCSGMAGEFERGITSLYQSPGGELWAGAPNGLWRWRPSPPKRYSTPGPSSVIRALAAGGGSFLIATQGGMRQLLDDEVRAYPPLVKYEFLALSLLQDREGGLWVGTEHGLLHLRHNRVDRFARPDGLSGDTVNSIFEDREGSIWVGTDGGLDSFRDVAAASISARQGLSNAAVNSVLAARDGSIWLGTQNGLDRLKDGELTIYKRPGRSPLNRQPLARVVLDDGLPDDNAQATFEDREGRIWVCSPHGVAYFESGRLNRVSSEPDGFVSAIAGDRSGNLWVSDEYKGLIHYSGTEKIEQWAWADLGRSDYASAMAAVPSGNGVWLGFRNGGVAYFSRGRLLQSYATVDGSGQSPVNGLMLDADGVLWASTEGGLSRIQARTAITLTTKNGLPCNSVYWMAKGQDLSIWVYMACGLARIYQSELRAWLSNPSYVLKLMTFNGSDGVMSHSLTTVSSAVGHVPSPSMAPDGKLWFSALSGASFVDPRHLPFNNLPPPVHIEEIIADHKIASSRRLPPFTRDLEIDYTALSFVAPEKNRFKYKLEGYDREWVDAGNRRQAFYSSLGPKSYRFRVIASNNSGVWNETGDTLDFSIAPAYYQTTWFAALCVVAFLASIWGLYRLRIYQIQREFGAQLEGRVDERLRVARELHDTLLQSFHGLLPRFQAVYNLLPGRVADAKQVLETALDDAGKAITEARDAVQGMRSSTVVTNDLAKAVETFGEELAAHQGATYGNAASFSAEMEGAPQDLHPILRDEIYRIAAEGLRNAFHHAQARRIEVEIRYGTRDFRVRVRDDGTGIDPSILGQEGRVGHFGLRGMRERAEQIGGKLEVWSERGAGTEIELTLPASLAYGRKGGGLCQFFTRKLAEKS